MAFASTDDVKARRGRPFVEEEEKTAELLLEAAQSVIEDAVGKDEAGIVALKGAVPSVLRFLTVEKVFKAMANPAGLSSESETLGAHSHTSRFNAGENSDLLLSELEERIARQAVYGKLSGTAFQRSLVSPPDPISS